MSQIFATNQASQVIKTVAAAATPEAIVSTSTPFRFAIVLGKKAARTNNTGSVYLGPTSANDAQPYEVAPGDTIFFPMPGNNLTLDLKDWYIDVVNAGDGLTVIHW